LQTAKRRDGLNFIDLQEQFRRYKTEIMEEIQKVLDSAQFILGPAVAELEKALASHTGVKHAIGCASGTDALVLGLLANGIKPGDEVIVPDFTFFATAEVVAFLGAVPVFVDVEDESFNIDVRLIERHITKQTKGIIPVSLFGQCADLDEINALAASHGLWVMEDAAQSYGASYKGRKSGSITQIAATSFFPAKPLGCYGDGGAVFTNDDGIARSVRELLNHGQSARYKHSRLGINGRLDTLQAAILCVKLRHFDDEMRAKQRIASVYQEKLKGYVNVPKLRSHNESVWAQFTVRSSKRDSIVGHLKEKGIPTAIHYPIPLHAQEVFSAMRLRDDDFPVSTRVSNEVLSLPMHPFILDADVDLICRAVIEAAK
jgi:UDP-2-acetamido-2-deoxy-ribo-hexuluronate aminotransferase